VATSKEEFEKAFRILSQFERQLIPTEDFCWEYITDRVEPSKPTLWRNIEFRDEYDRVKKLVKSYKEGDVVFYLVTSQESLKDAEIKKLKEEVCLLKEQLSRERERLAYAAVVARRENIDPTMFEESSPLIGAIARRKKHG